MVNGEAFEMTAIDGACDLVINGINFHYIAERSTEYLILNITEEVELNNWQHLLKTERTKQPDNLEDLRKKKQIIKLLPHSTLVFAINR